MRLVHVYGKSDEAAAGAWAVHKLVTVRIPDRTHCALLDHRGAVLDIVSNLDNS
jgi:hypothetical protein